MPLPLNRGKLYHCPNCGSEDLAKHPKTDHLHMCEVCHSRFTTETLETHLNAKTNLTN